VTTHASRHRLGTDVLRRAVLVLAIAGLAVLTALWSVAPPAAADSHCDTQASDAPIRDCRTLIELRSDLDPDDRLNWLESTDMADWDGVFATRDLGVLTVAIHPTISTYTDSNPLSLGGTVPAGHGSLPNLRFLRMWRVGLTGSIPTELGNLSNLEELRLDQNRLTGAIPAEIGGLSNLNSLSLSINELSGGIPSELGNLSSLKYLSLDRNLLGLETHPTTENPTPMCSLSRYLPAWETSRICWFCT
jgi:hypothetical protein